MSKGSGRDARRTAAFDFDLERKLKQLKGFDSPRPPRYVDAFDQFFFFFLARVSCTTTFKTATQLCM
jgi:hypothetical protein